MRNLSDLALTEAVVAKLGPDTDPRLREVVSALVRHLHAFVREVELTPDELMAGLRFLNEVGRTGDPATGRDEFILLSDTLGVTMQVDALAHAKPPGATESSVLGPFYREAAPVMPTPGDIAPGERHGVAFVSGRVLDVDGRPLAGALLDVWQTAPNGLYETQDPDQPDFNLRGRLVAGAEGRYVLRTVRPVSYPIPHDGPAGRLLDATHRHPFRPAHIHFIVSAEGCVPVTTQLFVAGDPYIDADAVFGVKDSLIVPFVEHTAPADAAARGVEAPFYTVEYDFRLERAG